MRPIAFKKNTLPQQPATTATTPEVKQVSYQDSVVDLTKELARPVAEPKSPAAKPETTRSSATPGADNGNTRTAAADGAAKPLVEDTAKMRETVDKVKAKLEEEIEAHIDNPRRAAETSLRFINTIRFFAYPWLYKKIMFTGPEIENIEKVQKKVGDSGMAGKTAELNEYENTLLKKWRFWEDQCKNVSWSDTEIKTAAEIGHLKLAEIKMFRWLMANEWAIVLLVMEFKRFGPVIGHRMGLGEISLDNLL